MAIEDANLRREPHSRLTGGLLVEALRIYLELLDVRRDDLNRINVFPVADRDTGHNLYHTVRALVEGLSEGSLDEVAGELVERTARSGRGASGLILSEALQSFAGALIATAAPDGDRLAAALEAASRGAARAVMDPVEGTILTAARRAADEAAAAAPVDAGLVARSARDGAWHAVAESPARLQVLGDAGVVDAGAVGYALLLDVITGVLDGGVVPRRQMAAATSRPVPPAGERHELVVLLEDPDREDLLRGWAALGSSVVVGGAAGGALAHIHTADASAACDVAAAAGRVIRIEVTDLHTQSAADEGEASVIVVADDVGDARALLGAGADRLIAPAASGDVLRGVEGSMPRRAVVIALGREAVAAAGEAEASGRAMKLVVAADAAEVAALVLQSRS